MKHLIILTFLCILDSIGARAQDETDYYVDTIANIDDKLEAISILAQGANDLCLFDFTKRLDKPNCTFSYHELKKEYPLPNAKIHLRAEVLAYFISSFAFADSAQKIIDSITIEFLPSKRNSPPVHSWSFFPSPSSQNTTEEQRMQDLLYFLPFISEYEIREDNVEILLREWPGITPEYDRIQYANVLSFVAYDYVFRRNKKPTVISYLLADGKMIRVHPYFNIFSDIIFKQVVYGLTKKQKHEY